LKYAGLALQAMDTVTRKEIANLAEFQKMSLREQLRLQNLEREKVVYQNKIRIYGLFSGLGVFFLIAALLYWNNKKKQKTNKILQQALIDLKATQGQLIQSEKMASLGELTAGIAHEIQNPLNFVNNFSEVNKELIAELRQEIKKGNLEGVDLISKDMEVNEEKINHHGKRADAIVKGMLQHSRASSGQKEPTDINALCDEYLRLSYHGLRAKDKSFNATFKTDFDASLPEINVVPQDIGRVILNLINNAFYAVSEKQKQNIQDYEPAVWVSTRRAGSPSGAGGIGAKIEISVKDNGPGIADHIKEKIFQPFFTTKPTGQGTGLGLSLSYDIVKAHGGELTMKTKEDEGSKFIILLPVDRITPAG
jgi:signal transduction histidine kinase